jgi:hypothetical protein
MARNTPRMRSVRRGIALFSLPLVAAAMGGTAAIALGGDRNSGIGGRVVPCGIVLERPAPCAVKSDRAGTVLIGQRDRIVRRAKVQSDGSFRVRLGAGHYWLQASSSGTRGPRTGATVAEGQWTTVTLVAGQVASPAHAGLAP